MSGDARTELKFHFEGYHSESWLEARVKGFLFRIKSSFPETKTYQFKTEVRHKGETLVNLYDSIYEALDGCNDWYFHAQRGMLDVRED